MANRIEVKKINRQMVYNSIFRNNTISKQEIANSTGLSVPTVSQNLQELKESGLVDMIGAFESTGGRRASKFTCVYNARLAVGIDITANHITVVIINLASDIEYGVIRRHMKFEDTDSYYNKVQDIVREGILSNHLDEDKILGVGISLPSIVNRHSNKVTYSRVIDACADIRDHFTSRFSFPVEIFNDANAAAYAEMWKEDSKKPMFYIMLSNSVGGAFILNQDIFLGDNCRSSEVGHIKIVPNGRKCYCGERGCVNAYCSALLLSERCGGSLETFFEKLHDGDQESLKVFDQYLQYLAIAVVNTRMLYDCDVVIGGYVGAFITEKYLNALKEKVAAINPYEDNSDFLRQCAYKKEASAVGSALYFIRKFIGEI